MNLNHKTSYCILCRNTVINWLVCIFVAANLLAGSSLAKTADENKIGELIEKNLKSGQPVWLNDGQSKFFAILTPDQSGRPKGGVILLHDAAGNPDAADVIRPLRERLPEHGWVTLAIQLPQIDNLGDSASHQNIFNKRIIKAAEYLQSKGISNLILIGHGSGATTSASFLAAPEQKSISAFVGISLGLPYSTEKPNAVPELLKNITLPILDIYGSRDLDFVVASAKNRALAAKNSDSNNPGSKSIDSFKRSAMATTQTNKISGYIVYRQIIIEGADHQFSGLNQALTKRILGWLERHAKGVTISSAPR